MYSAWWANPCWIAGCFLLAGGRSYWALGLGAVGSILAISFFIQYPAGVGPGYFAWLASLLTLSIAGYACMPRILDPVKPSGVDDF